MLLAQIEGFIEIARQGNMRRAAVRPLDQPAGAYGPAPGARGGARRSLFRRTHSGMVLTPPAAPSCRMPNGRSRRSAAVAPRPRARARRHRRARAGGRSRGQRLCAAGDPGPLHGATSGRSPSRPDRPLGGDRRPRRARRGRARDRQAAPRPARPQPSALRGRARPRRPAGPSVRHGRARSTSRRSGTPSSSCSTGRRATTTCTNALFRVAGVVPRGVTEVDNIEAAKRMVERGLGVALLPGTAVADALSRRLAPGDRARRHGHDPAADRRGRAARVPAARRRSWIRCGDSSTGSRSSSRWAASPIVGDDLSRPDELARAEPRSRATPSGFESCLGTTSRLTADLVDDVTVHVEALDHHRRHVCTCGWCTSPRGRVGIRQLRRPPRREPAVHDRRDDLRLAERLDDHGLDPD